MVVGGVEKRPLRLFLLTTSQLSYYAVYGAMSTILVPDEIKRVATGRAAVALSQALVFIALCDLLGLSVGWASDRSFHACRFGQRSPFIVGGAAASVALLALFLAAHHFLPVGTIPAALLLFVALAVTYSAINAVVPDVCHPDSRGTAATFNVVNGAIGSVLGVALFIVDMPLVVPIAVLAALVVLCTTLTVWASSHSQKPPPQQEPQLSQQEQPPPAPKEDIPLVAPRSEDDNNGGRDDKKCKSRLLAALRSYGLDVRRNPDFVLCCFMRMSWAFGNTALGFIQYYLADAGHVAQDEVKKYTSILGVIGLGGYLISSPAAKLGDCFSRKVPVVIGTLLISAALILPAFMFDWVVIYSLAIFTGISGGFYQSGELPMMFAVLPSSKDTARSMSMLTAMFMVGLIAGTEVCGGILQAYNIPGTSSYVFEGYTVIFLLSCALRILAMIFALSINLDRAKQCQVSADGDSTQLIPPHDTTSASQPTPESATIV